VIFNLLNRFGDASLRKKHDRMTAQLKRIASNNLALRTVNTALAAQVQAERAGKATQGRLLAIAHDANAAKQQRIDELADRIARMDAELAQMSGQLRDALEQLAGFEAIADETRAKRHYDGMGDE
jgi:hypothetical protein